MGDVLNELKKLGTPMRFVETDEFGALLKQAAEDPKKAMMMTTMLAYQSAANRHPAHLVGVNNEYTSQVLLRLGFRWSEPDTDYVSKMLTAIAQLGFFDLN